MRYTPTILDQVFVAIVVVEVDEALILFTVEDAVIVPPAIIAKLCLSLFVALLIATTIPAAATEDGLTNAEIVNGGAVTGVVVEDKY